MRTLIWAAAFGCALALSGCGSKDTGASGEQDDAVEAGVKAAGGGGMPANWKATDACAILDKAVVAEILKQPVSDAQVSLVHEPGSVDAGTSECTYAGADGGTVASLMTRWSPINDNTAESIAGAKSAMVATMKAFSDKQIEDVPGLGKAAFFAPGIDQLNVFIDDARMITVTVRKIPDGANGKDIAIALAKKAGA